MNNITFYVIDTTSDLVSAKYTDRSDNFAFQWIDSRKRAEVVFEGYDKRFGYFIETNNGSMQFRMLIENIGNKKDAKYISKLITSGATSLITYNSKKQDEVEKINTILIHNTKDIARITANKISSFCDLYDYNKSNDKRNLMELIIRDNLHDFSREMVSIYKNLEQINFEFVISELLGTNIDKSKLAFNFHRLHSLLLLSLFVVQDDLNAKNIRYTLDEYDGEIKAHYDSLKTAFVQILDNCRKYCRDRTLLEIKIQKKHDFLKIYFVMNSIYCNEDEKESIFEYKKRGYQAVKKSPGNGIGLYIVNKMLELNGFSISFNVNTGPEDVDGIKYSNNSFIITIPITCCR